MRHTQSHSRGWYGLRSMVALVALVLLAGLATVGCKENAAATKACAKSAGSTACKACCGMHGSNVTSVGSQCTCY